MATDIVLYHFPKTLSTRVRWWLEEAEIPYQSVTVDIRRHEQDVPEFRKISPFGYIPVLIDGDLILRDSLAICLHLGFRFPDTGLCPAIGTLELSQYLQWLSYAATEAHKIVSNVVVSHRLRRLGYEKTDEIYARESFIKLLDIYDTQLSNMQFLAGDKITGADLYNASLFAYADSIGLIPESGNVRTWLNQLTALPSYERALAPVKKSSSKNRTTSRKKKSTT